MSIRIRRQHTVLRLFCHFVRLSGELRIMITLPKFKALLGPIAEKMTDEQIGQLRDAEYRIADAVFDQWLGTFNKKRAKQHGFNNPLEHNVVETAEEKNSHDNE